jgi:hypothetical protein
MAITSKEINLTQLDKELGGHGLIADFNVPSKKLVLPADNSPVTEEELENAISNHKAISVEDEVKAKQLQRQAVLDRLGITAVEAALLLS